MPRGLRIGVVGAGPAGLLFALLAKRRDPHDLVVVLEQNAPDATFGFGVVFSAGALAFLERDEPAIYAALTAAMQTWPEWPHTEAAQVAAAASRSASANTSCGLFPPSSSATRFNRRAAAA